MYAIGYENTILVHVNSSLNPSTPLVPQFIDPPASSNPFPLLESAAILV